MARNLRTRSFVAGWERSHGDSPAVASQPPSQECFTADSLARAEASARRLPVSSAAVASAANSRVRDRAAWIRRMFRGWTTPRQGLVGGDGG